MIRIPRKPLVAAFVLSIALCLFFAARLVMGAIYWADAAHQNQPIEGWMRLGYVARSWDVPREALTEALALAPENLPRASLERIAETSGVPLPVLIERLENAIERLQAEERPRD